MSQNEVAVTLIAIIYGLMFTDLFSGFNRLLRSRKRVKWHWLPILTAWYIFIMLINNWWVIANDTTKFNNFLSFFLYGHIFVLIYLLVSSVFPSVIPEEGIDLKVFYFNKHRYFWALMSGVFISSIFTKIFVGTMSSNAIDLLNLLPTTVLVLMFISLSIWKNYRLHSIFVVLFFVEALAEVFLSAV
ncbi:MAG: hypothetical protein KKA84_12815 [Bacteroidetes bacterium]|nr:hypothetical protein [Bacteroidota bacterium]